MKIFDDMTFSGRPEALGRLIERLDQSPQIGPWKRDPEAEQSHATIRPAPNTDRCVRTKDQIEFPDALLWLIAREKGASTWRVTNIVPTESNASFSESTYYSLLISFREATLPLASEFGVAISVPRLEVGPEYWLTPKQETLLHSFSQNANRSTGAGHPRDRERWNAFVIAVHRDGSNLDGADLKRILIEHERWPEAAATELAYLFDYEQALLNDLAKTA